MQNGKRVLVVYGSRHQGNTRRLVQALADKYPIDLLDAEAGESALLESYDVIGFASGIDFGRFYPKVTETAKMLPAGKAVFALFTCARDNGKFGIEIEEIARDRGCTYLGRFGCKGYNTYGPWKLIGGMNKGHPSAEDIVQAMAFFERIQKKQEMD